MKARVPGRGRRWTDWFGADSEVQPVWTEESGGEDTVLIGGGAGSSLFVFTKASVPGMRLIVPGEMAGTVGPPRAPRSA